jgi:hypothetical protein
MQIEDIISQDGFVKICNDNDICYIKTDFFYLGCQFSWRGNFHPKKVSPICVIGHSDYPVTDDITNKFDMVFCINRQTSNENTYGLPLGITSDCDDSSKHRILGNKDIMIEVINEYIPKNNLVYLNFSIDTFPVLRNQVFNTFKDKTWVKIGETIFTIEGRKKYLQEIKSSKFVLCPRGNGIDTHRIWEALYMGSIPIVIYEDAHHLFTDLPILFIDDWNEINEDFLNQKYDEMSIVDWSYDKLKLSYWENFIKQKINSISN